MNIAPHTSHAEKRTNEPWIKREKNVPAPGAALAVAMQKPGEWLLLNG